MTIEAKLEAMGLTLPAPLVPPGNFELIKAHAGLAYVAGHGPFAGRRYSSKGSSAATSPPTRPTRRPG